MYSIDRKYINESIVKKSKFISIIMPYNNNINKILEHIKKEYKGATHYTYAYKTRNSKKYSDDGEPSMTAGFPILEALEEKELTDVVCVVIRFYGGIKLGTGGLRRAYKTSALEVINKCDIKKSQEKRLLKITFDYNNTNEVMNILKNYITEEEIFKDDVTLKVYVDIDFDIEKIIPHCKSVEEIKKAFILI